MLNRKRVVNIPFLFNVTTFTKKAAKAAGQSPPSLGVGTICYPDAIYSSIKEKLQKKDKNAEINSMQSDLDTDVQFADADKLLGGQWIQNTEWSFIMEMSDSIGDQILYYNKDNSQFFWDESYDLDIFFIKGAEYVPNYISKEELNTLLSEREIESISEEFSLSSGTNY